MFCNFDLCDLFQYLTQEINTDFSEIPEIPGHFVIWDICIRPKKPIFTNHSTLCMPNTISPILKEHCEKKDKYRNLNKNMHIPISGK